MVKRYMRTLLALLLCCAMLASNLGFAQEELAIAAVTIGEAEPAAEAAIEPAEEAEPEAAEPEQAPEPEQPAEADAEPEPDEAPEQDAEPEAEEAPEGDAEPEADEAPEGDAEPDPDEAPEEGEPEQTPDEEHSVIWDPSMEETVEGEDFADEPCEHEWEMDWDTEVSHCTKCGEECHHEQNEDWPTLYEPVDPYNPEIISFDREGHTMETIKHDMKHCLNCGLWYNLRSEPLGVITRPHFFIDEDANEVDYCMWCGYYKGCDHAAADSWEDIMWDTEDGRPEALEDGKHHGGQGRTAIGEWCPDCEQFVSLHDIGELQYYEREHNWNTDEDPAVCWDCGATNTCEHTGDVDENEGIRWEETPVDNGDGNHGGMGRRATWKWCPDCECDFGLQYLDDGPQHYDEPHNWNREEDPAVCWDCGAENTCQHTGDVDENEGIRWEEEPVDTGNGTHGGMGRKGKWKWCPDCDCDFDMQFEDDEPVYYEEEHRWNGDVDPAVCWDCGATNTCEHTGEVDYNEGIRWEETPVDKGNGNHGGMGRKGKWKWCHDCECDFDLQLEDEEPVYYEEEHRWNTDENPIRCWDCGAEVDCDHPHAEPEGDPWYDPLDDGSSWDPETGSRDDEGCHGIPAIRNQDWYCPDCEFHYTTHDEDTYDGPHDWDNERNGSVCKICGWGNPCEHRYEELCDDSYFEMDAANPDNEINDDTHRVHGTFFNHKYCPDCEIDFWEKEEGVAEGEHEWDWSFDDENPISWCIYCHTPNPCEHKNSKVYDDGQYEPDPAYGDDYVESRDENEHIYHAIRLYSKICLDCGSIFDRVEEPIEENDGLITEEHRFQAEDPYHCYICGWDNPCDHPDWEATCEDFETNGRTQVLEVGAGGCHVVNVIYDANVVCLNCGLQFHIHDNNFEHEGDHEWVDDEDGNSASICRFCKMENPCPHPDQFIEEITWWESKEGTQPTDNGNGTHHGFFCQMHRFHCEQCDAWWGDGPVDSEDYEEMDLEHGWDGDDGCRTCYHCGAQNPCQHEGEDLECVDSNVEDYGDEFTVKRMTKETHSLSNVARVWRHMRCNNCGAEYDTWEENCDYEGGHEWDDDGTKCWICNYSNPCQHPEDQVEHRIWDEVSDSERAGVIFADERQHTVHMRQVEEYLCHKCGTSWGWNVIEEYSNPWTDDHTWYWDDDEGKMLCDVCHYENTSCSHEDRDVWGDWYELDENSEVTRSDENGHTIEHAIHVHEYFCRDCQCNFKEYEEDVTWEGDHEWDGDRDYAVCWACEWANPCQHPESRWIIDDRIEVDESYMDGSIISTDADTHTIHAIRIKRTHCDQCGAEIGFEVIGDGFVTTEPHEWNPDNEAHDCWICGYENPCQHTDPELVDDWFDPYMDQFDENATSEGHTVHGDHHYQWHCDVCDSDYETVDVDTEEFQDGHSWDWRDGKSICEICGFENKCNHLATEAWKSYYLRMEKGGIVSSNATSHTGWFSEITGRHCLDCNSLIDREIGEPKQITLPHLWGGDEGDCCEICGWDNTCDHEGTLEVVDMYECHLNEDSRNKITPEGHEVYCDIEASVRCTKCGAEFDTSMEDQFFAGEHEWDTDPQGVIRCKFCEFESTCEHKNYTLATWFEVDVERSTADENGHTLYGTQHFGKHCSDCDMDFDMDTSERDQPITGAHLYEIGENDGERCVLCGYERPECDHPESAQIVTAAWVGLDNEAGLMGSDASGHIISVVTYERVCCGECGMILDYQRVNRENEKTVKMLHSFNDEGGTVCGVCGWKNTCTHEGTTETLENWEGFGGEYISRDQQGHTSYGVHFSQKHCTRCGAYWGIENVNGCELKTDKHVWDEVNGKYCYTCLYENTCKHTRAAQKTDEDRILMPELTNDATHTMAVMRTTYKHCDECGADFDFSYSDVELVTEEHGSGATCPDCGFVASDKLDLTGLSFAETSVTLGIGETYMPKLNKTPAKATSAITFQSDAPGVFSVNEAGQIKAIAVGGGTLTATGNGVSATLRVQVEGAPTSIALDPKELSLSVGETARLTAKASGSGNIHVNWSSSDTTKATVDADGSVTGIGKGEAVITATLYNGVSAACTVTVLSAPSAASMRLTIDKDKILVGERVNASVEFVDTHGSYEIVSENTAVATVAKNGSGYTITGVAAGSATITARAFNGAEVSQKITVVGAPDKLAFENKPSKMGVGEKYTLVPLLTRVDGAECIGTVTYTSSKPAVISVDASSGVLTANKTGSATITAECGNLKATAKISVKKGATGIALDKKALSLSIGETPITLNATLTPKGAVANAHWSSSNPEVARVDAYTGKVEPVGTGLATITASIFDEKYVAECAVTVGNAPTKDTMKVVPARLRLSKGETLEVQVEFSNGTGGSYTLSSSDTTVLAIDKKTGKITAKKKGTAQIIATAWNGESAVSEIITVTPAPTGVKEVPKSKTVMMGDFLVVKPVLAPAGAESVLTVTSSNEAVASVEMKTDETGATEYHVTAKTIGKANIVFTTANKKKATCKITVKSAPALITLSKYELSLAYDGSPTSRYTMTEKLKGTMAPKGCAGTLLWKSDDPSVASVDKNGKVVPQGIGHTTVRAYVAHADGYVVCEAACSVDVKAAPTKDNTKLELKGGGTQIRAGETVETVINHIESAGNPKAGTYKSTSPKIAKVNAKSGKITALKAGTATISVKMYNGVTLELLIEVI